jgi:hypothetical protein
MGLTVATKCLSEHMTALKNFSYQLVTISLRLIAEVLGLGHHGSEFHQGNVPGLLGIQTADARLLFVRF